MDNTAKSLDVLLRKTQLARYLKGKSLGSGNINQLINRKHLWVRKKRAFITGVTGQDGSYLAEFLLQKGYEVHGVKRQASLFNTSRVDHIYEDSNVDNANFMLHYGDLTDHLTSLDYSHR